MGFDIAAAFQSCFLLGKPARCGAAEREAAHSDGKAYISVLQLKNKDSGPHFDLEVGVPGNWRRQRSWFVRLTVDLRHGP